MVIAVDTGAISDLPGAITLGGCDIFNPQTHRKIADYLNGRKADVLMSDMAPNASGIHELDHHRIMELCHAASTLANEVLCEGGTLLCKGLQGTCIAGFLLSLREHYKTVRECRLKSTRKESTEIYILGRGFFQK
jgi:23S rRNA (uridine2552-2'-O)-methyltransferase